MFNDLFSESGFSLDRCRAFLSIVEAGGITQASEGSASRQSQLSRQLGELETWLGAKLLTRGRERFSLTEAGRELALILKANFSELSRLKSTCSGRLPTLRMGAGESLLQWIVIPGLALMKEPIQAKWNLKNMRSEDILNGLMEGSLDLGIMRRSSAVKTLHAQPLGELKYGLFIPEGIFKRVTSGGKPDRLPMATLEGESHLNKLMEKLPLQKGIEADVILECSSLSQSAEVVRDGLAAAILPMAASARLSSFGVISIPIVVPKSEVTKLTLVWNPTTARLLPDFQAWASCLTGVFSRQVKGF